MGVCIGLMLCAFAAWMGIDNKVQIAKPNMIVVVVPLAMVSSSCGDGRRVLARSRNASAPFTAINRASSDGWDIDLEDRLLLPDGSVKK
jgi:hypothetical protein